MSLFETLGAGLPLREHISPEGVEEKILHEDRFIITQTMGGKFRVYRLSSAGKQLSLGVAESVSAAAVVLAENMLIAGRLYLVAFSVKPKTEKKS